MLLQDQCEIGQLLYYLAAVHLKHLEMAEQVKRLQVQHPKQVLGLYMEAGGIIIVTIIILQV